MKEFTRLIHFYEKLDSALNLLPGSGNPCGECRRCCTGFNLFVTRHEFKCMAENLKAKGHEPAIGFKPASIAEIDKVEDPGTRCPLYREGTGCLVYEVRPLFCRLYGSYLRKGSFHYELCVFKNPVPYESVEEIPLWSEYARVLSSHPASSGFLVPL